MEDIYVRQERRCAMNADLKKYAFITRKILKRKKDKVLASYICLFPYY
jgi:hypothetical protein